MESNKTCSKQIIYAPNEKIDKYQLKYLDILTIQIISSLKSALKIFHEQETIECINVTSFSNISYSSNSEYWPQISQHNDSIHSIIYDVHVFQVEHPKFFLSQATQAIY